MNSMCDDVCAILYRQYSDTTGVYDYTGADKNVDSLSALLAVLRDNNVGDHVPTELVVIRLTETQTRSD